MCVCVCVPSGNGYQEFTVRASVLRAQSNHNPHIHTFNVVKAPSSKLKLSCVQKGVAREEHVGKVGANKSNNRSVRPSTTTPTKLNNTHAG